MESGVIWVAGNLLSLHNPRYLTDLKFRAQAWAQQEAAVCIHGIARGHPLIALAANGRRCRHSVH